MPAKNEKTSVAQGDITARAKTESVSARPAYDYIASRIGPSKPLDFESLQAICRPNRIWSLDAQLWGVLLTPSLYVSVHNDGDKQRTDIRLLKWPYLPEDGRALQGTVMFDLLPLPDGIPQHLVTDALRETDKLVAKANETRRRWQVYQNYMDNLKSRLSIGRFEVKVGHVVAGVTPKGEGKVVELSERQILRRMRAYNVMWNRLPGSLREKYDKPFLAPTRMYFSPSGRIGYR